jgi:formylglycine-generating enzyme required for sulfatase activity
MSDCGGGTESCCTSLEVTGGTFDRTYANTGGGATGLANPATVSSFRLDKYEVTVGRFRQFVTAWNNGAGWTPPAGSGKHTHVNAGNGLVSSGGDAGTFYEPGWVASNDVEIALPSNGFMTWTASPGSQEKLPVNAVTWFTAYAFCIWDGGFLPSAAEWEYASAGGSQQREYPWGSTDPSTTNQYAIYGCYYPNPAASDGGYGSCTGVTNIAPVGAASLGAGAWGHLDLAGNLWEFNLDWREDTDSYFEPCVDCAYLTPSGAQAMRGSGFANSGAASLWPTDIGGLVSGDTDFGVGWRCARTP